MTQNTTQFANSHHPGFQFPLNQDSMKIGQETRAVGPGDAIAIPPGETHQISNTGKETLVFLCCCAPGYEHVDTVLLEE